MGLGEGKFGGSSVRVKSRVGLEEGYSRDRRKGKEQGWHLMMDRTRARDRFLS